MAAHVSRGVLETGGDADTTWALELLERAFERLAARMQSDADELRRLHHVPIPHGAPTPSASIGEPGAPTRTGLHAARVRLELALLCELRGGCDGALVFELERRALKDRLHTLFPGLLPRDLVPG